jgi:hypothetical protein
MTETEHLKCDLCHEIFVVTHVNRGLAIAVVRHKVNSHFRLVHLDFTVPYPNTIHKSVNARPSPEYIERHREEVKIYKRAYRAAHPEEAHAREQAYRTEHREKQRAYSRTYRAAHREEIWVYNRTYRAARRKARA